MKYKHLGISAVIIAIVVIPSSNIAMADETMWFDCLPREVIEHSNRVHVRCANDLVYPGPGTTPDAILRNTKNIRYVAIAKNDKDIVNRFTSMATAALVAEQSFRVKIPYTDNTNVTSCASADCRTPLSFGVRR